jgi:flavin-dependent dehydrogenase
VTTGAPAVIAGASFAGLAAARVLGPRAVLVDPEEIGDGQTSACAAPARVIEGLGAAASIQDIQHELVIHTPGREIHWPVPEPFCTFDYRTCCRAAFAETGAAFVRASVRGHRDTVALTSAGELPARILIDATGWRAALVGGAHAADGGGRAGPSSAARRGGYFGVETEVPAGFAPGLHFYFWPEFAPDGYAWAFPAGAVSRVGVLSYRGRSNLGPALEGFRRHLGLPPGPRHGGYLGTHHAAPVSGGVFVVGDAAGHCLPFSGEGIRSAVWAAGVCARLAARILDGRLSRAAAASAYAAYIGRQRRRRRVLEWSTAAVLRLPARMLGHLAAWMSHPGPLEAFMRHYLAMFAADEAAATAALPAGVSD